MKATPALCRALAVLGPAAAFAVLLTLLPSNSSPLVAQPKADDHDKPRKIEIGKEWPMFGGTPSRNLINTVDKNVPTTWSNDEDNFKNIKWTANLGSKAYGGPVIADGKIFIGTNNDNPRNSRDSKDGKAIDKGVLMCFNQADGKFLWQAVYNKLPAGRVNDWPAEGICSSPVVEGDRLYFVCNRAELTCASVNGYQAGKGMEPTEKGYTTPTDAGIIWRLDMIKELGVFPHNLSTCSPLIIGDTIFLITSNGVDEGHINIPSPEAPSFIAVNKKTGKVIWKNNFPTARLVAAKKAGQKVDIEKLKDQGLVLMHGQWSNPAYAEPNGKPQVVFPGGDGWVYAFNPKNGELLWKFDCNPKDAYYRLGSDGTRSDFVCTPVIWENKLYIGTGQDPEHKKGVGHLWCIDITKEPKNKDKDISPAFKPPAKEGDAPQTIFDPKDPANKDSGLIWHYGGYIVPKPAKGRPYRFGRTLSTVCVHDGLVYTSELDGIVHCFDAKTGEHYWEHDMNADTWASPTWVNGHVYIGNDKGKILVFKAGKKKELVNTIDMNCTYVRNTPVVVDGVLYVITENSTQLWAITGKGGK